MFTVHRALLGQKAIQWVGACFPKGIVYDTTNITTVLCSLQHDTFHLVLGRPESRYPACIVVTLYRVSPPHLLQPPM
jgi:hypothetical protein